MVPVPLPQNPFPLSAYHAAYEKCLALEAAAPNLERLLGCPPPIVCARLLGHLLRLTHEENARGKIQEAIKSASDNTTLMNLGGMYFDHIVRTFRRAKGPTPFQTSHPSRESFEDEREYAQSIIDEATFGRSSARTFVLRRDNYSCMITGKGDESTDGGYYLQAAHIIPQSQANRGAAGESSNQSFRTSGVWATLSMFYKDPFIEELAGNRIHRPENMMTLEMNIHAFFDDLRLWLKPVDGQPNTYRTAVAREGLRQIHSLPEYVTFSTNTNIPLPNPGYLALHALCCEIAWMSGAAEYVMDIDRRRDNSTVMSGERSAHDLAAVLRPLTGLQHVE